MAGTSKRENWTTHDGACTSCRTRKIRCGREKPKCSCCRRDQVECVYSSPPKRVNHVKVLCQSFDEIQDRLINMQGELSWLTATLKQSNISGRPGSETDNPPPPTSRPHSSYDDECPATPTMAGHVVRDGGTQIERYYGPWTLVSQCRDLETSLAPHVKRLNDKVVGGLMQKMMKDTTNSDDNDLEYSASQLDTSISLPPRQLLSVMLDSFLKQADYSTDIFSHQTIYEAVDRVYREPSGPTSEAWALCFNLIILLTLGAEHPVRSDDPFVRPMLEAAHATARKASFFMSPRLVNVQALALFSLLAQQYHTDNESLGEFIFARACILARECGLHQSNNSLAPSSTLSAHETEERQKVLRSLYIRDRYNSIANGALTWLPTGISRSSQSISRSSSGALKDIQPSLSEVQYAAQRELSVLQDGLYQLLSSVDAPELSLSEQRTSLSQLMQRLQSWSETYKVPSSTRPTSIDQLSLHLAFLGTRMRAQDGDSRDTDGVRHVSEDLLNDARLSCLLVVASSNGPLDQSLSEQLSQLLHKSAVSSPQQASRSSSTSSSVSTSTSSPSPTPLNAPYRGSPLHFPPSSYTLGQESTPTPLPLHRLAIVFPSIAVFVLARHILGSDSVQRVSPSTSSTTHRKEQKQQEDDEDITLLEALLARFRTELPSCPSASRAKLDSSAHGSKLGRLLQSLVEIIHVVRGSVNEDLTDDANVEAEENFVYAPGPMHGTTSSMLLESSHTGHFSEMDFSGDGGNMSPSHLGLPPTPSSSHSTWAAARDAMSFSATPLLTTSNSSYAASIIPTPPGMADTSFDISQFLHQMGNSPVMWENGYGQGDIQLQQPPQQQQQKESCCPQETTKRRSKKRPRTNGARE